MKALVIIDVQNDFISGSLPVLGALDIIPYINSIQKEYDLVVATQDWHVSNHKSFASQHPDKKEYDVINLGGVEQVLWPNHCVQGHFGAELHKELEVNRVEAIFRKGMNPEIDSYSAFYDNVRRKSTHLNDYLKAVGVTDIYFCGLAGDYCVYYSAMDALELGFNSFILEKGIKSIDEIRWRNCKDTFERQGGLVI